MDSLALVAVTDAARDPSPLVDALARHHPELEVRAVWCGDPQLRPCIAVPWVRPAALDGPPWERHLAAAPRGRSMWSAICAAAGELLDDGAPNVVVLEVGAVAIVG